MKFIIIILSSYLLGSIPFAYILIKIYAKKDIRNLGTGNVGAMNSYEITKKKWLGTVVFLLDALKGAFTILAIRWIMHNDFSAILLSSCFVIIGHNYSIFLKFKGGRGLATALGCAVLINPMMLFLWVLMWIIGFYIIKRDIIAANITATLAVPIIFFILPSSLINFTSFVDFQSAIHIKLLMLLICVIIFIRHISPMRELIKKT